MSKHFTNTELESLYLDLMTELADAEEAGATHQAATVWGQLKRVQRFIETETVSHGPKR